MGGLSVGILVFELALADLNIGFYINSPGGAAVDSPTDAMQNCSSSEISCIAYHIITLVFAARCYA